MVIDDHTFAEVARHLHTVSEDLLDGMRKVIDLNPDAPGSAEREKKRQKWLKAVEALVRMNGEVLTLAELLRALLSANRQEQGQTKVS